MKFPNDNYYEGKLVDGERHGVGTLFDVDGNLLKTGIWDHDKLVKWNFEKILKVKLKKIHINFQIFIIRQTNY